MFSMKIISLLFLLLASQAGIAAERFVFVQEYSSGMGNVQPAHGGQYIYGDPAPQIRKDSPAYLTGSVKRVNWSFFSPEEEVALEEIKDKKMAERARAKILAERKSYLAAVKKIDWPKVVVKGDEVCVPELVGAESPDWKDYLTCYKGQQ